MPLPPHDPVAQVRLESFFGPSVVKSSSKKVEAPKGKGLKNKGKLAAGNANKKFKK